MDSATVTPLLTEEQIRLGLERLARELTREYQNDEPCLVACLRGSLVFAADLIRRMPIPLRIDFLHASSYGAGTVSSGTVELRLLPEPDEVRARRVILLDDILDSGRTLHAARLKLESVGAREIRTCVFLEKRIEREFEKKADYRCFEIGDEFVVGYGLDYAGRYRNLPYLGILKQDAR
ncbi:MAG: hypoxanthine phosphoribosyltransferase [Planctomycetes bacterium]|nr:hypoxanthine phosphoribosyltransferase [Planctomycetota bacterium]